MWFWKRSDPKGSGGETALLDTVEKVLRASGSKVTRRRTSIAVDMGKYDTVIEASAPANRSTSIGMVRGVVSIRTDIPAEIRRMLTPGLSCQWNALASLGAVVEPEERGVTPFVGSRVTVFEEDGEAFRNVHLPLILGAINCGLEGIGSAMRAFLGGATGAERQPSLWTRHDLAMTAESVSQLCECGTDGRQLIAKFATEVTGDLSMLDMSTEAHPGLGGGLLCRLLLSSRVRNPQVACLRLNREEMRAVTSPPHFGAWTTGPKGDRLIYVTFLPNVLHDAIPGIALNVAVWARERAAWASRCVADC